MSNIVKFPGATSRGKPSETVGLPKHEPAAATEGVPRASVFAQIIRVVWIVTVLVWPLLKWALALATFVRLVMAVVSWDDPNSHAGWIALGHFVALVALTMFVSTYRPKGTQ